MPRGWTSRKSFASRWAAVVALLPALVGAAPSLAQRPTTAPAAGPTLADKQGLIRDRLVQLEDRIFQIRQSLAKAEPEKAARLARSLSESRKRLVRQQLDELVAMLRAGAYADAIEHENKVTEDLQAILKLLLEDPDQLDDRKEEIRRLEQFRSDLNKIIDRQEKHREEAQADSKEQRTSDSLSEAAAQVRQLLQRQESLGRSDQQGPEAAPAQAELEQQTRDLKKSMEKPQGDRKDERSRREKASRALGKAADAMRGAGGALQQSRSSESKSAQSEASNQLQEALKQLEKQSEPSASKRSTDDQARDQRDTAEQTKKLAESMKKCGGGPQSQDQSGDQKGSGQKGQQGGEDSGESQEPAPGQEDVQEAVPSQQGAADELERKKPASAQKKQTQALDRLRQAKKALEEALEQLRLEQQEETLAAMEARFRAMLARQVECTRGTRKLLGVGKLMWKRADLLELNELSGRQRWVGDEADKALFVLTEDGTTIIFPEIVGQVRDDAREAADRLARTALSPSLLALQEQIEQVLRELIDAVQKKQEELQQQQGKQPGQSGDMEDRALLPGSAELKLLRSCQIRVNSMTTKLQEERGAAKSELPEVKHRLQRLSRRQDQVSEMVKKLHESTLQAP